MRGNKKRLIAAFGIVIGLIIARPALADDERYSAFLKDPVLRQNIINAAAKSTVILQNPCPTAQYSVATTPIILKPMDFDSAGLATAGMVRFPVKEEGCGIARLLNVLVWTQGPGAAGTSPLAPGSTIADPILQKDAGGRAYDAAMRAALPDAACRIKYLADTEFVDRQNSAEDPSKLVSWREKWTIVLCNKKVIVPIRFTPDSTGTAILAGGSEMKVFDLLGHP